jgi:hypothetical protein
MITGTTGSCDIDLDMRLAGRKEVRCGRATDGRGRAVEVVFTRTRWGPTSDDLRLRPVSMLSFSFPLSLLVPVSCDALSIQ